jgi:hypothetical protein
MTLRSSIVRFVVFFGLIYGVLIAPWPRWNALYGEYFRALGGAFFAADDENRLVRFEAATDDGPLDTRIVLANPRLRTPSGRISGRILALDSRGVGWIPTALVTALIVATPIAWKRRLWALVPGLLAIHGYLVFTIGVYIWNQSAAGDELALVRLSPALKTVANGLEETFVTQVGASIVVPVIIWLVVTFRRGDFPESKESIRRIQ